MPLDVIRVIDSDTFGISTGDEFKTAFRLWAKCWQQVPAASLPDDDRVLAHLAGLSENLPKWKKVRAVALRGFVKCSDGRLYHPVIAEKAIEAMGKREQHVEREENEQSRQQRYRERRKSLFELLRHHGIVPPADTKMPELERLASSLNASPSVTESVTPVTHGDVTHDVTATAIEKDIDQTKTVNPEVRAHAGGEPPACVRPGELSAAMREHSIEASPHDPRIIAAAERGMTPETIRAACAEAKAAKPGERIPPAYVLSIANRWLADAAQAPRPGGASNARSARLTPAEQRNAISDRNAEAWLNGHAEPDPTVIDMEP
nr:DUF1376 domain-containing protein [Burkholderia cenocepacia]